VRLSTGVLQCFGLGASGQIGDDGFTDRHVPTPILDP
jgi:hypothetical protein